MRPMNISIYSLLFKLIVCIFSCVEQSLCMNIYSSSDCKMPWTVAEKTFSVEKLNWLRELLQDCLISRSRDPEWASHSPDLNPTDSTYVYRNNPKIIHELKEAIPSKIHEIPKKGCVRVSENLRVVFKCPRGSS